MADIDEPDLLDVLLVALEAARGHQDTRRPDKDFWVFPRRDIGRTKLLDRLDFITRTWMLAAWDASTGTYDSKPAILADHVCAARAAVDVQLMAVITQTLRVPLVAGDGIDATLRALRAVFTLHHARHRNITSVYAATTHRLIAHLGR